MSVLNDYECKMHGIFEAYERRCPSGCSRTFVKQVFLKAPSFRSHNTKRVDRELNNIAKDYNFSDIRNDPKSGESMMTTMGRTGKGTQWVDVPHAQPGFSKKGGRSPVFDIRSLGADAGATPGFKPGDFLPPRPIYEGTHKP